MLYDHPEVYDALFHPEGHAAHYAALAERYPAAVLELACGSGQLTVPLAQHDRTVVGIDLSRPMLAAAEHARSPSVVSSRPLMLKLRIGVDDRPHGSRVATGRVDATLSRIARLSRSIAARQRAHWQHPGARTSLGSCALSFSQSPPSARSHSF